MRTARALINLSALRHNYTEVRRYAPDSKIMCVIKANAYGHGMVEVAKALPEADGFAVSCLDEALLLRQQNIMQPITVFQGFQSTAELQACRQQDLWPVIHHRSQLELLATGKIRLENIWLKIATGINRLGFRPEEIEDVWRQLQHSKCAERIRLMTHMARADEGPTVANDPTLKQIQLFDSIAARFETECSLANSAALIAWPNARRDWVRPGIMLYGASPFLPDRGPALNLRPVMTLTSRLIAVNQRKRNEPIGYGGTWICSADTPVGVVAMGYGDGYPRHIDASTVVLLQGKRIPVIGRVSMDLLTLDLSGVDAAVGDEVTLWGAGLPVDDIASHAETIAYELLCNVYGRVQYEYIDASAEPA